MVLFRTPSLNPVPTPRAGGQSVYYTVGKVFGEVLAKEDGPQVFFVHQEPHGVTSPHFHKVDQFQIFTTGAGKIGMKPLVTKTVHYADAYTTYGPIVSEDEGVDYFTVRLNADCSAHYMPEARKEKLRKSGRHFAVPLDDSVGEAGTPIPLIECQDDGLAAFIIKLAAGDALELPPLTGSGRLFTVMAGSLVSADGVEYRNWAWGSVNATETSTGCIAGHGGASIVCLDYPNTDSLH